MKARTFAPLLLALAPLACDEPADDERIGHTVHEWEAQSATDERLSSHLYIVNRAVDILGRKQTLASARNAFLLMTATDCRPRWQQGLIDADFKAEYNNGLSDTAPGSTQTEYVESGATWASHFYDPDSGTNWLGLPYPTARGEANRHLTAARTALRAGDRYTGCYELGLALHYFTDLTQPMHAANFAATSPPLMLHGNLEAYAQEQQARWVGTDWSGTPRGDADAVLYATARASKKLWAETRKAVQAAYARRFCPWSLAAVDYPECWEGDGGVDSAVGRSLTSAHGATAQYLFAAALPR